MGEFGLTAPAGLLSANPLVLLGLAFFIPKANSAPDNHALVVNLINRM